MTESILASEPMIRLAVFAGVLAAMAVWELAAPRRRQDIPRVLRWSNNLAVVAIDTLLVRLVFPVTAVAWAAFIDAQDWGLLSAVELPYWLAVIIAFVLLDLAIYGQHVLFHAVPWFWRLHRVHHADLEFDVTTGLRFHPGEILLSMAIKFVVIALLGAPVLAVLLFEATLNATSMFSHSNVKMPQRLDRWLRWALVTPDMHRVHHSVAREETDSNYGFNLPWWDRLFGTYRAQPDAGHDGMMIGQRDFRDRRDLWIDRMLLQPLENRKR